MTRARHAVITGRGAICAIGADVPSFEAAVRAQRAATPTLAPGCSRPDAPLSYVIPEGVLPAGKRDEPLSTLAIATVGQALSEAGIQPSEMPHDDVGFIMSNFLGPSGPVESYIEALEIKGPRPMKPTHFVDTILSMPGSRVGIEYKLRGSTAVLGGSSSFELALSWLRQGREHTVVAGGGESLSPKCTRYHAELVRRSGVERSPLGQGAAFIVLESSQSADSRGRQVYGEVLGAGAASEPQDVSVPWSVDPSGRAVELSMRAALPDAGIEEDDITLVVLAAGDAESQACEMAGVERLFGARTSQLEVRRPKQFFGEALGGSAGLCLLAALVELRSTGGIAIVNCLEMGGAVTSLVVRGPG
jgi:3-oxoacyl-[acyl-carrier-protein] synthase II